MKKSYLLLAAAAISLASCTNDDFLGNLFNEEKTEEITFGSKAPNLTRTEYASDVAAAKLNYHFVVYGTKHSAAEDGTATNDELVYNMYNLEWAANTAGTTESNTHNWEYVGKTAYSPDVTTTQSVKYWDYTAANGYTFYAFSSNNISYPAASTDLVSVTKVTEDPATSGKSVYKKGYTVTIKDGANKDNIFYADRVEVPKDNYGDPVVFIFRNMTSKVRVGFYETVPGYSVKIDKFYYDTDATAAVTTYKAMDTESTNAFAASLQNVGTPGTDGNKLTVTYYDDTDASIENRATVTNTSVKYDYTLKLGNGVLNTELGTASNACTWDKTGGAYTSIYPFEANSNPMLIRCDYTLTSTDGSNETIKVKNARVVVPVQYVQWKSNYAYTYLFKISDKSNGTTGNMPTDPDNPGGDPTNDDPEGLFPITFDAVVVSTDDASYDQETITSVASNSVTTYQEGKVVTAFNEYRPSKDIYAVNSNISTHAVIAPSAIGDADGQAQVYKVTGSNISEATVLAQLTGADNGISFTAAGASLVQTVPANDGTNYDFGAKGAVKFQGEASNYYAYVYCTTKYKATTYKAAAEYSASTTYYFKTDKNVYYAASGLTADNYPTYKSQLYIVDQAGEAGVYDVKVIRVQSAAEAAGDYTYADYTYKAKSIETSGNTVTFTYETANYTGTNVLDDIARYLGALYRDANVKKITEDFTSGTENTYIWDEANAGNLKGSNWYDETNKQTLVKAITTWYGSNPSATSITLNLDGVATTFKFVKE